VLDDRPGRKPNRQKISVNRRVEWVVSVRRAGDTAEAPAIAVPVFEFQEDLEERLAIMTIDGGLTEQEARAALGLPSGLPSYFAIVDEITSGRYLGPEDWLLATSVWVERCRRQTAEVWGASRDGISN
jgi:hypothetical protein